MANEAVLVYETEQPVQMTVATGTGIEKGAGLTLSDPMTAATVTASLAACAGIAHSEHVVNDGTKLGVYRGGYWKVTASGSITLGDLVQFSTNNLVQSINVEDNFYAGESMEAVGDGDTFVMHLKPGNLDR